MFRGIKLAAFLLGFTLFLHRSVPELGDSIAAARAFTREIEFDYVTWTLDALGIKLGQAGLRANNYMSEEDSRQMVLDYIDLVNHIQSAERDLHDIYADPNINDAETASVEMRGKLDDLYEQRKQLSPLVESIIQAQVSTVVADFGLTLGGLPIPPVLYRVTPLPLALVISPREVIRQEGDISLNPNLTIDERSTLEDQVDSNLNVSSLVVNVGGIGLYPTMVMQSSNLTWLTEVVSHEWIHNTLTLRPLGMSYFSTPQLRTMNETTASIADKEISLVLLERYYPEFLPPPPPLPAPDEGPSEPPPPPTFDFRAEMHETRVTADSLLSEGKVEEAEAYMEERRHVFWDQGYHIRKLNQAYFAFYGAYGDVPGGAAGEDPVGAAVRDLRAQSPSLAAFVNRISWMWSFEQLLQAVEQE